ncbi:MAG: hypothetical protein ACLP50_12165 [Solirubrobacteraceae bacterium]
MAEQVLVLERGGEQRLHLGELPQFVIGRAVLARGSPVRVLCWAGNTDDMMILPEVRDGLRGRRLGPDITVVDRGFSSDAKPAPSRADLLPDPKHSISHQVSSALTPTTSTRTASPTAPSRTARRSLATQARSGTEAIVRRDADDLRRRCTRPAPAQANAS